MLIYILTVANPDDIHDWGEDDTVNGILFAGSPYLTLEGAQTSAQEYLDTFNEDLLNDGEEPDENDVRTLVWKQDEQLLPSPTWRAEGAAGDIWMIREHEVGP